MTCGRNTELVSFSLFDLYDVHVRFYGIEVEETSFFLDLGARDFPQVISFILM
jgi:hypothetical protein